MLLVCCWCRFRDQGLTELLETVYLMTGPQYLSSIQDAITSASSWQQVEGAFFCLRAVAGRVRRHSSSSVPPNGCNGQAERAQQEQQLLLGLFETVCSPNSRVAAFLSNPYVCATAAGLVGAYAAWFDNTVNSPLEGALRLLLHALSFRDSWRAAAAAFRALTMRCATRLANVPVLQSLAAAATAAIAPPPQPGQVGFRAAVAGCALREDGETAELTCMHVSLHTAGFCRDCCGSSTPAVHSVGLCSRLTSCVPPGSCPRLCRLPAWCSCSWRTAKQCWRAWCAL